MTGPKTLHVFDPANPPKDERGQAQMLSVMVILEAMKVVARDLGAHHAMNGAMGALLNFLLAMEDGTPEPGLRAEICSCLRGTAEHIERLDATMGAKSEATKGKN